MLSLISKHKNRLFIPVILIATLVLPIPGITQQVHIDMPVFQKGMCYATWDRDKFSSTYSDMALEMLKNIGVEYLQVTVTQYQKKFNSTKIYASQFTPSDRSIKHVIKKAHQLGLKVMLKPHIDLIDKEGGTYWRADIGFYTEEGWNKWFKSYEKFINHYAKIAEKYDVEIFCVGTELSFSTQETEKWEKVIESIRNVYNGKLIYAANWDNYKNVKFWDKLDFIGIDAYFPLTYKYNPTLEDIKAGWEKWKYEIEMWHEGIKQPIVFTEIGYSSSAHAPSEPWKNGAGSADVEIQAKCYNAFFETIFNCQWLAGVYWWRWAPSIYGGGKNNRHFTPYKKPAQNILEKKYKEVKRLGKDINPEDLLMDKEKIDPILESVVVEKTSEILFGMKNPVLTNTSTLMPGLKTKDNAQFKIDWKEKHDIMSRERTK